MASKKITITVIVLAVAIGLAGKILRSQAAYGWRVTGGGTYSAVSLRPGLVYVSHIASDHVTVIDPDSNNIIGKIKGGDGPCSVELSAQSPYGYISNFRSADVTVFDKATGATVATVPAGGRSSHLILTQDGNYLLIGHEIGQGGGDGLWFLDTKTNKIVTKLADGLGILCRRESDGKIYQSQIFTPDVCVIDPVKQAIAKRIEVGGRPMDLAFTPDQRRLLVANFDLNELEEIDTETDSVVARIPGVEVARGVGVSKDGRFAFVTNVTKSTVTVVDLAMSKVVKAVPVGVQPTSVAMSEDGRFAYISCQGNGTVSVIDTKTQEVMRTIAVDNNPIAVQVK